MKLHTHKARVLLVEDEAIIAEEIAERLRRLGYDVVGSHDTAGDAVATARRLRPDLILMDIHLKGSMDGITATERICGEIDVPVVYLTAHSDDSTLARAQSSGPFGYVLKPFQERDLIIAIEIALQRHGAEKLLRDSEARWATTLRSIGDGVVATDAERRVTFMNPTAEELTGWSLVQAKGMLASDVIRLSGTAALTEHPLDRALEKRVTIKIDDPINLVDRRGRNIAIEDSAAPIVQGSGQLIGAVMAFRDCSARLESERALQRAREELGEARRMEALGRLAGGVAHDFNNMLTVILGCSEQLQASPVLQAAEASALRDLVQAGRKASALTERLLSIGRQRTLEPRTLDLVGLVRDSEPMLRRVLDPDVELVFEESEGRLPVALDVESFHQVLVNLAVNANDAMRPSRGRLTLRTDLHEYGDDAPGQLEPGRHAVLHVTDTGHGMDEETRERMFEPFFSTKPGRGTGLGLATSYGTVVQSRGHMEVASVPAEGTTFSIHLPLAEEGTGAAPTARPPSLRRGTETILLVENDPAVRRIAAEGLRAFGYSVQPAENGAEALRSFAAAPRRIDLLLTDLGLPDGDGREFAELLRTRDPGLRTLFVSGHSREELERRGGVAPPSADVLGKPFTPSVLARRVRETLDRGVRPSGPPDA